MGKRLIYCLLGILTALFLSACNRGPGVVATDSLSQPEPTRTAPEPEGSEPPPGHELAEVEEFSYALFEGPGYRLLVPEHWERVDALEEIWLIDPETGNCLLLEQADVAFDSRLEQIREEFSDSDAAAGSGMELVDLDTALTVGGCRAFRFVMESDRTDWMTYLENSLGRALSTANWEEDRERVSIVYYDIETGQSVLSMAFMEFSGSLDHVERRVAGSLELDPSYRASYLYGDLYRTEFYEVLLPEGWEVEDSIDSMTQLIDPATSNQIRIDVDPAMLALADAVVDEESMRAYAEYEYGESYENYTVSRVIPVMVDGQEGMALSFSVDLEDGTPVWVHLYCYVHDLRLYTVRYLSFVEGWESQADAFVASIRHVKE